MERSTLFKATLLGTAALAAALGATDGLFSEAEAAIPIPDELDTSFDSLDRLLEQAHSYHAPAEAILRLQPIIEYRVADLEKLISAMEHVAPHDAKELEELRQAYRKLDTMKDSIDTLAERLKGLDSVRNGYGVNLVASRGAALIPHFDVDALEKVHAHTVSLYTGVTYGEVLVTDAQGRLVERKLSDLISIGYTSDKISPILAHKLMEVFGDTHTGHDGWSLNSGAFEKEEAHKLGSSHNAAPQVLRCVDIAPEQYGDPKFIDAKRLGQFALAARVDDAVEFFQLETGTKVTVQEMKDALTKEWQGKISDSDLKYILGKVVSNGSGIHIHVLFTHENFHSAYVPESKVAMR